MGKVREPTDNPFQVSKDATFEANVHVQGQVTSDTNPTKYLATLQGGWENYGASYGPASYFKDASNIVHLTGLIKSGNTASGVTVLPLPVGFRPAYREIFSVGTGGGAGGGAGRLDVDSTGEVVTGAGLSSNYVSLSGISFLAES